MSVLSVVVAQLTEKRLNGLGYDGTVPCLVCGHEARVRIFTCMRNGWPEHCGETMQLWTEEFPGNRTAEGDSAAGREDGSHLPPRGERPGVNGHTNEMYPGPIVSGPGGTRKDGNQ